MTATVKEPVTLEVKNALITVNQYSVNINSVDMSDIFHRLIGKGYHKAHITISINPPDPDTTTITVGDKILEVADLKNYVEEDKDE